MALCKSGMVDKTRSFSLFYIQRALKEVIICYVNLSTGMIVALKRAIKPCLDMVDTQTKKCTP